MRVKVVSAAGPEDTWGPHHTPVTHFVEHHSRPASRLASSTRCRSLQETQTADQSDALVQYQRVGSPWWFQRQAIAMFSAGAVLGPFLDGMHSSNDVLHYHDPFVLRVGNWQLESCWWVFVLFGVAGTIIGVGVPWLDQQLNRQPPAQPPNQPSTTPRATQLLSGAAAHTAPTWPQVLLCISLFVTQYGLSGKLEQPLLNHPGALDVVLIAYAVAHFGVFDRTVAGLALSVATMVGGPLIEVFLINVLHLYHYEHPQVYGVPIWIAWVYFCGGPAVGNLGRRVSATLTAHHK